LVGVAIGVYDTATITVSEIMRVKQWKYG